MSSASVRSIPFLSFIALIFAWNIPLVSLIFLKRSLVFPILFIRLNLCPLRKFGGWQMSVCHFRSIQEKNSKIEKKRNHYEKPPNALQHFYFELSIAHTSHHLQHRFPKWYTVLVSCYFIGKWKSKKLSSNKHPEVTLVRCSEVVNKRPPHTWTTHTDSSRRYQGWCGDTNYSYPSWIRCVASILTWAGMCLVFWHMNPQSMRTRIYKYTFTALPGLAQSERASCGKFFFIPYLEVC